MNAKTFKSQTRHNLDKHQVNQEGTQKFDKTKGYPNYIKDPNQHMI